MTDPTEPTDLQHDPDPQDLIDAGDYDPDLDDDAVQAPTEVTDPDDPSYVPLPPPEEL